MKVTQQTLPLFNEMYELKFSEEEMANAFLVHDEVIKNLKDLGKQFRTGGVGIIYHVINNGINTITHTMHVSDSWGGRIEINVNKPTPSEESVDENAVIPLPETTSYFQFSTSSLTHNRSDNIKVKKLDAQQFHTLSENLYFCNELNISALSEEERIKLDTTEIFDDLLWLIEVTNGPAVLEKLKTDSLTTDSAVNTDHQLQDTFDSITEMCRWLMPDAKETLVTDDKLELKYRESGTRENATGYIEGIFEKDNYRLGILTIFIRDYYRSASHRRLFLLSHEDDLFNYADLGRFCILGRLNYYSYSTTHLEKNALFGKILFTEEVSIPTPDVLQWMGRHVTENVTQLYDSSQLKLSTKKFLEEKRRETEAEEEKKALESKLADKIESIKKGKKLILNGMEITKTTISYEGQILKLTSDDDWVYSLLKQLSRAYKFDDINWDSVFDTFIGTTSSKSSKGQIGDVKFNLVYEHSNNSAGITSTRTKINDFRINKMEIQDCLRRAVCYTTQTDFDEFLGNVSSCSLKFHRYLQTGVDFEVSGLRYNEGFSFKLPLERRKNLMYIVLGDNEYKVRDTNRLINLQNTRDLGEIMELLLGDKVIEGLRLDDAKSLLKLAKIEFQDAVDKSKKLLEETEKTLKLVKQSNIQMNEIRVEEGYIVNGKMRQYVVANTEKCEVYEYPSGRYICIVDKSTSQVGKDKLVNRLYALANDQALAQDIHTLK